jgi:DNA invertase Pin-like site-specific DNA recombinase
MMRFAFKGRCSTEDQQDPAASRAWQLTRAKALVEPHGGVIVAEYFDAGQSRSVPWRRHPQASALLSELRNPSRGFEAVVIGEPQREFYGNQFGDTFPLFVHYGAPLWVPEVGGAIDPNNEAHELIMSVFGGMSKGERNRVKVRVRTTMAALAHMEGRFLGGRPPYGYTLIDLGPHPNPSKAADGRQLHGLATDEQTAAAVRRIFAEFIEGAGLFAIAEGLTRDGIPSPSAHDRARNPHRSGLAWSKSAVRTILTNPRYTGRQVWNRQRKQEVLLDVDDVGLGHVTKMSWNPIDKRISSDRIVHPPIISDETFARAPAAAGRPGTRPLRAHPAPGGQALPTARAPALRLLRPADAGRVEPPSALLPLPVPLRIRPGQPHRPPPQRLPARGRGRACAGPLADRGLRSRPRDRTNRRPPRRPGHRDRRHRRNGTPEDHRMRPQARPAPRSRHRPHGDRRVDRSHDEIARIVAGLSDYLDVLRHADPADKAELYKQLGLKLTYRPQEQTVRAEARLSPQRSEKGSCPRTDTHPMPTPFRGPAC